jgi:hypothetical protein
MQNASDLCRHGVTPARSAHAKLSLELGIEIADGDACHRINDVSAINAVKLRDWPIHIPTSIRREVNRGSRSGQLSSVADPNALEGISLKPDQLETGAPRGVVRLHFENECKLGFRVVE